MSDYDKIKQSPEYHEARRDVQAMINRDVQPLARHVDEIGNAVKATEGKIDALIQHPKAFSMMFAAIFGALSENPETIKKIIGHLQDSLETAQKQNAHIAVFSELSQTVTLLIAMLHAKQ